VYKNIYTNKYVKVVEANPVRDGDKLLTLYVLEDGERWEANLFYKYHVWVDADKM
jgi:hypothetical protein